MSSTHKSITPANPLAGMKLAAPSAAPALCTLLAIPTCFWPGHRSSSPRSNSASSSATPPLHNPVCCHSIPTRYGLTPPPRPLLPPLRRAARSNPMMSPALWPLVLLASINSASSSWPPPVVRAAPLNWPSAAPASRAPSSTTTANTAFLSILPIRRGSRRGGTCLPVRQARRLGRGAIPSCSFQSTSPAGVIFLRRGHFLQSPLLLPFLPTAGAVSELQPSETKRECPPGVLPGAPLPSPPGIPRLAYTNTYPYPALGHSPSSLPASIRKNQREIS